MLFLKHEIDFFLATFILALDKCLTGSNLPKKAVTFCKSLGTDHHGENDMATETAWWLGFASGTLDFTCR